jgi:Tfp pilus assembly protein PilN
MASDFNFARVPFTNERLPRLVFGLLVLGVLGVSAGHGYLLTRYLLREQEELDTRVDELRSEIDRTEEAIARAESSLSVERTAVGNEKTRFLTGLFRRKSFSWTGLFNELETITPPSVRVTSIAPEEKDSEITVTLTIVGRALEDVLEMVQALESSSFFATVYPISEANAEELGGRISGTAATLSLRYVEDRRPAAEPSAAEGEEELDDGEAPAPDEPDEYDDEVPR